MEKMALHTSGAHLVGKYGTAYRRCSPSWKRWRCLQVALLSMASQCCVGHHFSFSSESRPSSVRRSRPLDSFTLRSDPAKKDKFSFLFFKFAKEYKLCCHVCQILYHNTVYTGGLPIRNCLHTSLQIYCFFYCIFN